MHTTVKVVGMERVKNLLVQLPKNLNKEIKEKATLELARDLQKRIKHRAPVGKTGALRNSILIRKNKKGQIFIDINAYYGKYVEQGSAPHFIPRAYLEQHMKNPYSPGRYVNNAKRWVFISGKAQPFINPAIQSFRRDMPKILKRALNKAIQKSRRGGKK